MAKQKRSVWDDLSDRVRELLDDMERLFKPGARRAPVPVPVPARVPRPQRKKYTSPY
ncbi:MAG: hypothetical protein BroJett038_13150 [Chloroflexota bacterium]|nr:MAG: hypothetical protein BroJett038_13150 [Chloroflexota bacterium]